MFLTLPGRFSVLMIFLGSLLTFQPGCLREGGRSLASDDIVSPSPENPVWLFSFPDCLPTCTDEDRIALTERGRLEDLIVSAIDSATTEVTFSMYTFSRKPIYEALVRAAARGVRVQGIMDRGQFRNLLDECSPQTGCAPTTEPYTSSAYRSAALEERIAIVEADPLFRTASNTEKLALLFYDLPNGSGVKPAPGARRLVHNKFVMIDDRILVNGSGNWSSTAVSINLENLARFTASSHPDVISAFVCAFDVLWTGDANAFTQGLRRCESDAIKFAPAPRGGNNAVTMITDAIREAQTRIDIAMHHLTHRDIYSALEEALARGVTVRLLFDDDDCNARLEENLAALVMTGALVRYTPTNCSLFQLAHNKFGIFDDRIVVNGSGNWSNAGLTSNYENFIRFAAESDIAPFRSFYDQAWQIASERASCTCPANDAGCLERYCVGRDPR